MRKNQNRDVKKWEGVSKTEKRRRAKLDKSDVFSVTEAGKA